MDLLSFCARAYPYLSKFSVSLKLRGVCVGVMLLHGHRAIIWYAFGGSPVKFQGDGVVLKVDVFSHCYAVFLCMEANYDPLS